MSIANAVVKSRPVESDDETPLIVNEANVSESIGGTIGPHSDDGQEISLYEITQRIELSKMASMFFPSLMVKFFYICISVYLYGDLAIYAAAISKSLRDITCPSRVINGSINASFFTDSDASNVSNSQLVDLEFSHLELVKNVTDTCWNDTFTRHSLYQMFVTLVLITLGPLAFLNVTKTVYLQLITSLLRWISFSSMILLALMSILSGHSQGHPVPADVSGLPNLFGVSVYSFMCHHSLPSLITPIKKKKSIFRLLFIDYILILSFYLLLSFTGAFTFGENIQDIYTLNFQPNAQPQTVRELSAHGKVSLNNFGAIYGESPVKSVKFLEYFLPLFPVFTLSASFPIIAITLTNNLRALLSPFINARLSGGNNESIDRVISNNPVTEKLINRIAFPLLAVLPPIILALFTENLSILVGIVGSYAGAMIQYVIPALLVYYSRKFQVNSLQEVSLQSSGLNSFRSPFKSTNWIILVLIWSLIALIFVTIDHIIDLS